MGRVTRFIRDTIGNFFDGPIYQGLEDCIGNLRRFFGLITRYFSRVDVYSTFRSGHAHSIYVVLLDAVGFMT